MVPMLIFDANPWQDTMYDVLIIILGVGALLIGTLSSIDGRAQRQATMKIQEEIKAAVKELRVLDTENDKILNELEKDEELDREMIKKIDDKL
jgi:cell division protein FtsB